MHNFLDIEVCAAQVFQVTNAYGKEAAKQVNTSRALEPVKKDEILYVQAGGSMVLTRDNG
jgi:hypothetical protein